MVPDTDHREDPKRPLDHDQALRHILLIFRRPDDKLKTVLAVTTGLSLALEQFAGQEHIAGPVFLR